MLRKIKLYGKLAKFVGHRILEADVATAAEAVRFLVSNWPELERHMADQQYRVSVGSYDLIESELHDPAGQQDIKIVPVMTGAGAVGRIILGVALIALSFVSFGSSTLFSGVASATAKAALGSSALFGLGTSLVLGGVAQLLTPTPTLGTGADSQNDPRKSFSFSGIQNTSRPGVPVPVVYGEILVGSVVVSAGIDIVQVSA